MKVVGCKLYQKKGPHDMELNIGTSRMKPMAKGFLLCKDQCCECKCQWLYIWCVNPMNLYIIYAYTPMLYSYTYIVAIYIHIFTFTWEKCKYLSNALTQCHVNVLRCVLVSVYNI
jgi:hypothetical protein